MIGEIIMTPFNDLHTDQICDFARFNFRFAEEILLQNFYFVGLSEKIKF